MLQWWSSANPDTVQLQLKFAVSVELNRFRAKVVRRIINPCHSEHQRHGNGTTKCKAFHRSESSIQYKLMPLGERNGVNQVFNTSSCQWGSGLACLLLSAEWIFSSQSSLSAEWIFIFSSFSSPPHSQSPSRASTSFCRVHTFLYRVYCTCGTLRDFHVPLSRCYALGCPHFRIRMVAELSSSTSRFYHSIASIVDLHRSYQLPIDQSREGRQDWLRAESWEHFIFFSRSKIVDCVHEEQYTCCLCV